MPPVRNLPPGYTVAYPNRDKASSKATKSIVILLLLVSIGLMLIITIGGWSKLQGLKAVNFIWCIVYVIIAIYVARWNRGLLPIAAAFGILLLILALIAGTGVAGTSWFDRNHLGFASPKTLFGGKGFGPDLLGTFTLIVAPVQLLLIIFSMQGFAQGWNVEQEVRDDKAKRRGSTSASGPEPAAA